MSDDREICYGPEANQNKVSPPSSLKRKTTERRSSTTHEEPTAKRSLFEGLLTQSSSEECASSDDEEEFLDTQATQAVNYTPNNTLMKQPEDTFERYLKCDDGTYHELVDTEITIGRSTKCKIKVGADVVSRKHAVLTIEDRTVWLKAIQSLWILTGNEWLEVKPETETKLSHGARFCLAPPHQEKCPKGAEFSYQQNYIPANPNAVGSESFDAQYLQLLRNIEENGIYQKNKKGDNWTHDEAYHFNISLRCHDPNENLMPITTLRKMFAGTKAIIEALWYIRGDKDIKFLQDNQCTFWDAQAREDGTVGLNYGLLTNWPKKDGTVHNQLKEEVIKPLVDGKTSRNMVCTLSNPDEETVQTACTSSVQFAVTGDEELSLTVTQRSSDVILGLPHDVIAWSTILHLVRREVQRRSNRILNAGSLHFNIAAGGAHVYKMNERNMHELLRRQPKPGVRASLDVKTDEGMFELAKKYRRGQSSLVVRGYNNKSCYHPALQVKQATSC